MGFSQWGQLGFSVSLMACFPNEIVTMAISVSDPAMSREPGGIVLADPPPYPA
jgi:hypothetical protein